MKRRKWKGMREIEIKGIRMRNEKMRKKERKEERMI